MTFPLTPLPVRGELFYDGVWNAIPANAVRGFGTEDGDITIARGQPDEAPGIQAAGCQFGLKNPDGTYSPRNPVGSLYGKIGRNTPVRFLLDTPAWDITDTFSRSSTDSWGTPDVGPAYGHITAGGGSVNDFDVAGGEGTQVVGQANSYRLAWLDIQAVNGEALLGPINLPAVTPTGGSLEPGNIVVRKTDIDVYYLFRIVWTTANGITAQIVNPEGTSLINQTVLTSSDWTPGEDLMLRVQWDAGDFRMRVWQADSAEPTTWSAEATDYTYLGAGGIGVRSGAAASNSNVPVTFGYGNFEAVTDAPLFIGEVAQWPQRWESTGTDVWTAIEAGGITRRLGASKLINSAIRRDMVLGTDDAECLAYWALEDAAGSTQAESLVVGVGPMIAGGTSSGIGIEFAKEIGRTNPTYTGFPILAIATKPMPSFGGGGSLVGHCLPGVEPVASRSWTVQFIGRTYAFIHPNNVVMVSWLTPGGSFVRWEVVARSVDGGVDLIAYDSTGAATTLATTSFAILDNFAFRITAEQNGANVDTTYRVTRVTPAGEVGIEDTDSRAGTLAYPTRITINPAQEIIDTVEAIPGSPNINNDLVVAHLSAWDGIGPGMTAGGYTGPWAGWPGETSAERMQRLCEEDGIPFVLHGAAGTGAVMGPQGLLKFLDLIIEAAVADAGILYEPRGILGLGYHTRTSLYNKAPALELDYVEAHLSSVPLPTEDDQQTKNLIVATRAGGGTATYEVDEGPLSTQEPPNGVGVYDDPITVNVEKDTQLFDFASWRGNVRTWDEARWPLLDVSLHRAPFVADDDLFYAALYEDIADVLSLANVPSWLPPDLVVTQVRGTTMVLSNFTLDITWNTVPHGPYSVGVFDDESLGKFDTAGSETGEDVTTATTQFDVVTTATVLWTTDDAQFPFDIGMAGERVTVTDIAASTIVFGGVGAVDHDVNASVTPTLPSHAAGQLLVVYAAIRNSGAGIPQTPTNTPGWQRLPIFLADANTQVFAKIATSSAETDPIVTFIGGVANADTSAQAIRLNGRWYNLDNIVVAATNSLNVSAQNIAYNGLPVPCDNCIILYFAWKQDDWTSVTSPGTEFGEPDTTTGDDQGIVWSRQIQTTRASIASGSFTVTGGASAISRSAVAALRCDGQEFTVTRSVNGVEKAHNAGTPVKLWTPARFAR